MSKAPSLNILGPVSTAVFKSDIYSHFSNLRTLGLAECYCIQLNLYYWTSWGEEQLVRIMEGSDNRMAKVTGLNGVRRVGLSSDN